MKKANPHLKVKRGRPISDNPLANRLVVLLTADDVKSLDRARGETPRPHWVRSVLREVLGAA